MSNSPPCKDCPDRHRACWDQCAKYAHWKVEHDKVKAAEKEYKLRQREDFLHSEECKDAQRTYSISKDKQRRGKNHGL